AVFEFDPATVKEGKLIYEHPEVDIGTISYSRKRKVLTVGESTTWKPELTFFDDQTKAIYADLAAKLRGYELTLSSHDKAEDKFIVGSWNDRTLGARYLYDVKTKALTKLADVLPWLPEDAMAEMKPIQYTSR